MEDYYLDEITVVIREYNKLHKVKTDGGAGANEPPAANGIREVSAQEMFGI